MEDSILLSIKSLLGPDSDYEAFDNDIVLFINSAFATLTQLGVGPVNGFRISGSDETWSDFLGSAEDLESVKSYVYMKTRLAFDPPTSSSVLNSFEEACKEYEWRLNVAVD